MAVSQRRAAEEILQYIRSAVPLHESEGKAEVSFVIQTRTGKILPIELVDKNLSKSKSLTLFMNKTGIKEAIRVTDENFSIKKGVKYATKKDI